LQCRFLIYFSFQYISYFLQQSAYNKYSKRDLIINWHNYQRSIFFALNLFPPLWLFPLSLTLGFLLFLPSYFLFFRNLSSVFYLSDFYDIFIYFIILHIFPSDSMYHYSVINYWLFYFFSSESSIWLDFHSIEFRISNFSSICILFCLITQIKQILTLGFLF